MADNDRYGTKPPSGEIIESVEVSGRYGDDIAFTYNQPMVLDCSIDVIDSILYVRDDRDHNVFLPNKQKLFIDTETGQLKTADNIQEVKKWLGKKYYLVEMQLQN